MLTLTYPLVSGVNASAEIAQAVLDAAKAGDVEGVASALINAPANFVDGVLNGAGKILGVFPTPGLLTPYDPVMDFLGSGPIGQLLHARQLIADALKPIPVPATAAVAAAKVETANTTVTLSVPATAVAGTARPAQDVESTDGSESAQTTTGSDTGKTTGGTGAGGSSARKSAASSSGKSSDGADSGSKAPAKKTAGSARHAASKAG